MIIAQQKPLAKIEEFLKDYKKVLLVGCKGCVTVCSAGGRKEVGVLSSALKLARREQGNPLDVVEVTVERQCDTEYLDPLDEYLEDVDVVLSMACGAGVQFMAERFPGVVVLPALDTTFIGVNEKAGHWGERCQACGDCKLHLTGGICPVTRCSKSIMNGPCGGSVNGHCEIDKDVPCGWQLIIDRLDSLGVLEETYEKMIETPDWSTSRDGGPRKQVREDLE